MARGSGAAILEPGPKQGLDIPCELSRLILHPSKHTFLLEGIVSARGQAQRNLAWPRYQERKALKKKKKKINVKNGAFKVI